MWSEPEEDTPIAPTISGKWVVIAMFLFGFAATGTLWLYWHYHTAPFWPLQEAIARTYPKSVPRVEGGRFKGEADSPMILRMTLRVGFDPEAERERSQQLAVELFALAERTVNLDQFDELEFHFFWPRPEVGIVQETITMPVKPMRNRPEANSAEGS